MLHWSLKSIERGLKFDVDKLIVGVRVLYPNLGEGIVEKQSNSKDGERLTIRFDSGESRSFQSEKIIKNGLQIIN
jgi:hypothetical protein